MFCNLPTQQQQRLEPPNMPINWFPHCSFILLHSAHAAAEERLSQHVVCGADKSHNRAFLQLSNIAHTIIVLCTTIRQILHLFNFLTMAWHGDSVPFRFHYYSMLLLLIAMLQNGKLARRKSASEIHVG